MKRIMKESMGDCSTLEEFRFLVRCGECGRTWRSTPVRFSKARALYAREREAARERAAAEVPEIFNRCPVCGRLVCDRCFLICEDLDMCTACAGTLEVHGDIVAGSAASSQPPSAEAAGADFPEEDDATS